MPDAQDPKTDRLTNTSARALLHDARWALRLVWQTDPGLLLGMAALTLVRGVVPAGLALFARGIINTFVAVVASEDAALAPLVPWLLLGFGLTILEALGPLAQKYCSQRLQDEVNLRVTADILTHAARLDVAFFEDPRQREVIERAQNNTAVHFAQFVTNLLATLTNALQAVSLAGILVVLEPLVLVLLVPFGVPYLLFQWRLARRYYTKEHHRTPKRRWTHYFVSRMTDQQAVPEVKLLGLAPYLIGRFRMLMTAFRDQDRKLHLRGFAGSSVFAILTTVAFYVLFVRVILKAFAGSLTVGDIAIFGGATSRLRVTLDQAIRSLSSTMEHTLYIANLKQFLSVEPRVVSSGTVVPASNQGAITFDRVTFTYPGATEPTLTELSLRIEPGEIVGLVGENGAGKTTLVKLICRLYDPEAGRVSFDGVDLRDVPLEHLHSQIAFVLQGFGRYEATAADNIAYGDWQRLLGDRAEVERIARQAGVHDLIEAMPQGYDTMLGRLFGTHDLSGGQWQKMAMARAFARNASLLILDEPTSNLDAHAEYRLFSMFRELARGRTTLLISHRFSTLSMADRILVMDQGRIVEEGTHQELLAQAGNYATLYDLHRRQMDMAVS